MKLHSGLQKKSFSSLAFSIIESVVSMAVVSISFVSLYAGMSTGFYLTESARENLRATQLMLEKLEIIRLYTWDQITNVGFIPTNFTGNYAFNNTNSGLVYTGTLIVSNPTNLTASYTNDMKLITVTVNWTQGRISKSRTMNTLVTRNGLQQYVY